MLRTTASFTPPTTTNIANSRQAYSAQSQRQGLRLGEGVERILRQKFETGLRLVRETDRAQLQNAFEATLAGLKEFGDPFKAEWEQHPNGTHHFLDIFKYKEAEGQANQVVDFKFTIHFRDDAVYIQEQLEKLLNQKLPEYKERNYEPRVANIPTMRRITNLRTPSP